MTQLIQFFGTWFGAFVLGLYIPGFLYYADQYKAFNFKKDWGTAVADLVKTILWPVPFIIDMIKRLIAAIDG